MDKLILLALHTINATLWLCLGVFMVLLGDDGTPMENDWETTGGLIILASLIAKLYLVVTQVHARFTLVE